MEVPDPLSLQLLDLAAVCRVRVRETGEYHVDVEILELQQFGAKQLVVPFHVLVTTVIHKPIRTGLRRRQIGGHMDWDLRQAELLGSP